MLNPLSHPYSTAETFIYFIRLPWCCGIASNIYYCFSSLLLDLKFNYEDNKLNVGLVLLLVLMCVIRYNV